MAPPEPAVEDSGDQLDQPAAILYAAKSTEDVRGSIPTQLADCRDAARAEGRVILAEHHDNGYSAWSGNRGPGLEAALRTVQSARRTHSTVELWVQHSDRLARGDGLKGKHLAQRYFDALEQGFVLRSVQDDQNLRDALHAVLIGERNAEDSRRKSAAVKSGLRRTFDAGAWSGGPPPDGYAVDRRVDDRGHVTAHLVIEATRASIVRLAFHLAEEGHGDSAIARRLNQAGHRTQRRVIAAGERAGEEVAGKPWSRRRVQDMLTNPIYAGAVVWHRGADDEELNWSGRHDGLVSRDTFEKISRLRAGRDVAAKGRPRGGRNTASYLLSKLAECDRCGSPMYARTSGYKRKDGTQARHYVCANVVNQTGCCDMPPIPAQVDDTVRLTMRSMVLDFRAFLSAALESHDRNVGLVDAAINEVLENVDALDARTGRLEAEYTRQVDAGNATVSDFVARQLESAASQRRGCHERLAVLRAQRAKLLELEPRDAALDTYNARRELLDRLERALRCPAADAPDRREQGREQAWGLPQLRNPAATQHANEVLRANFRAIRLSVNVEGRITGYGIDPILREDSDIEWVYASTAQTGSDSQELRPVCAGSWFPSFVVAAPLVRSREAAPMP